jgi:hypothetical protein
MQTSGDFIRAFIEFSTRMEYGHYDFQCRFLFFLVVIGRDSAAVIRHRNGIVFMDNAVDNVAKSSQGLINRVIYYLINQVVQSSYPDISDVHGGTLSDGLETFQNLYVFSGVIVASVPVSVPYDFFI